MRKRSYIASRGAAKFEQLEERLLLSGFSSGNPAQFYDASGDLVTISLKGPGSGSLVFAGEGQSDVSSMVLSGTDQTSSLVITAKGPDNQTSIGGIVVNGSLKSITAKTTDLLGDITVNGSLVSLLLDDVSGADIVTTSPLDNLRAGMKITLDQALDTSVHSASPISSITVSEWLDADATADVIEAPWLGRLSVKGRRANAKLGLSALAGHFQADLNLSGLGELPRGRALGSAVIAGNISGAWDIGADSGNIKAGATASSWTLDVEGSVSSIYAANSLGGSISALWVGKIFTKYDLNVEIATSGTNSSGMSIVLLQAGSVRDVSLAVSGGINSIVVTEWLDTDEIPDTIEAAWIGKLITKGSRANSRTGLSASEGSFEADLDLSGQGISSTKPVLANAVIAGDLNAVDWDIAGLMGKFTAKGTVDNSTVRSDSGMLSLVLGRCYSSDFLAGVSPDVVRHAAELGELVSSTATIKSIAVKGTKFAKSRVIPPGILDANFSAYSVGSVRLPRSKFYVSNFDFDVWSYETLTGTEIPTANEPGSGSGDVYFVDPNGNNANSGTIGSPWQTIIRALQEAKPGDTVFLRDGIYRQDENLNQSYFADSATGQARITLAAYPGETPVITSMQLAEDTQDWTPVAGYDNVYFLDLLPQDDHLGGAMVERISNCSQDGVPLKLMTSYNDNGSPSDLTGPGQWVRNVNDWKLYVWSSDGLNPGNSNTEFSHFIHGGTNTISLLRDSSGDGSQGSYITFDGLTIEGGHYPIEIETDHVEIKNCVIRNSYADAIKVGGAEPDDPGNPDAPGDDDYYNSRYGLIENCDIYNFGEQGIDVTGGDYWIVRNNTIHDNANNRGDLPGGTKASGILFKNNSIGAVIEGNTIFNLDTAFGAISVGGRSFEGIVGEAVDALVKNNVIYNITGPYVLGFGAAISCTLYNNSISNCDLTSAVVQMRRSNDSDLRTNNRNISLIHNTFSDNNPTSGGYGQNHFSYREYHEGSVVGLTADYNTVDPWLTYYFGAVKNLQQFQSEGYETHSLAIAS